MEDCYLYDRPTTIGLMTRKDIPEVLEIERQSFSIPWTENNFTDALKSSTCMGLVCRRGDCVGGFAVYELRKESIEIMNFAVLNDFRRCGIGSDMFCKLKAKLRGERNLLRVCIAENDLTGHLFAKKMGFLCTQNVSAKEQEYNVPAYVFEYSCHVT